MSAPHVKKEIQELSHRPINKLSKPLTHFLEIESTSGIVLLIVTLLSLTLAQLPVGRHLVHLWHLPLSIGLGEHLVHISVEHLVNDGLMALFFFVIGLEIKREIVVGALKSVRHALLPVVAAIGGMVVPATIYLLLQVGTPVARGWGIPMATDIAFVVGILAIFSKYVPHGLRVLLLTLAIVDDLGAVLVIAFGYTESISWFWLASGVLAAGGIYALITVGMMSMLVFSLLGFFVWLCFYCSGVHATIAGVLLGLLTPVHGALTGKEVEAYGIREGDVLTTAEINGEADRVEVVRGFITVLRASLPPAEALQRLLHPWVAFLIMPLFAFVNAGVVVELRALTSSLAATVIAGLVIGKPVGIVGACLLAVKARCAELPAGVSWLKLVAGGVLAGIGFTMALFLTTLSLPHAFAAEAKIGVIAGSVISAIIGTILLIYSGTAHRGESR